MTSERDDDDPTRIAPGNGIIDFDGSTTATDLETWKKLPEDPDPERHLGYDWVPFEVFGRDENADEYLLLPEDKGMLTDDAYLVVEPGTIEDLDDWD